MDTEQTLREHALKEKAVMTFFKEAVKEVQAAFAEGSDRFVGVRMQMIAAFTFFEVLSNFWECYINRHRGPNERLTDWFKTFCETNNNETYKTNAYFKNLGVEPILDLRHSMVHFFGLSPQRPDKQIALGSSHMDKETFEKYEKGFKGDVAVFKPTQFYELFQKGGLLMIEKMLDNIHSSNKDENKKWEHIEGINRIFEKFKSEGAMQIVIPKSQNPQVHADNS